MFSQATSAFLIIFLFFYFSNSRGVNKVPHANQRTTLVQSREQEEALVGMTYTLSRGVLMSLTMSWLLIFILITSAGCRERRELQAWVNTGPTVDFKSWVNIGPSLFYLLWVNIGPTLLFYLKGWVNLGPMSVSGMTFTPCKRLVIFHTFCCRTSSLLSFLFF